MSRCIMRPGYKESSDGELAKRMGTFRRWIALKAVSSHRCPAKYLTEMLVFSISFLSNFIYGLCSDSEISAQYTIAMIDSPFPLHQTVVLGRAAQSSRNWSWSRSEAFVLAGVGAVLGKM